MYVDFLHSYYIYVFAHSNKPLKVSLKKIKLFTVIKSSINPRCLVEGLQCSSPSHQQDLRLCHKILPAGCFRWESPIFWMACNLKKFSDQKNYFIYFNQHKFFWNLLVPYTLNHRCSEGSKLSSSFSSSRSTMFSTYPGLIIDCCNISWYIYI